jgi:hypothetical protein
MTARAERMKMAQPTPTTGEQQSAEAAPRAQAARNIKRA